MRTFVQVPKIKPDRDSSFDVWALEYYYDWWAQKENETRTKSVAEKKQIERSGLSHVINYVYSQWGIGISEDCSALKDCEWVMATTFLFRTSFSLSAIVQCPPGSFPAFSSTFSFGRHAYRISFDWALNQANINVHLLIIRVRAAFWLIVYLLSRGWMKPVGWSDSPIAGHDDDDWAKSVKGSIRRRKIKKVQN